MPRILSIAAELSAPPSSPTVFRDVTLYGRIKEYEIIALAEKDLIPFYDNWFQNFGLWDYVYDLVPIDQLREDEVSVAITGGSKAYLSAHNYQEVLKYIV